MTFTPTRIGRCDACYHPQLGLEGDNLPLMVTTYDSGGGDVKEQQLCEACSDPEAPVFVELTTDQQIASLVAIGDLHVTGGVSLPISFFKADGTLRLPPWDYGGVPIDILKNSTEKTITFVVPVSCMNKMSDGHILQLFQLIEALRAAFERIVPPGWTVKS